MELAIPELDFEVSGSKFVDKNIFKQLESEVRSYCRSFPTTFERASGTVLVDKQGNEYLDFLAGAGSLNYGHNHPVLKGALLNYLTSDGITHSLDFYTAAKERFLKVFNTHVLKPRGLNYVVQFTGPTGANSVEASIKLARKVTGRENIIAFTNGFHGVTLGALSLTGNSHHRDAAGITMGGCVRAPYDGYMGREIDTLDYLEKVLDDRSSGYDHPAAVIVEAVQGEGGLNVASPDWLKRLEQICHSRKILLILDDIQAGCGRTGHFFSFEAAGIKPDMVNLSKSLSGFGLPFSVVLIDEKLDQWKPGEHNGTFRGNNHAFVTAAAAIEKFWRSDEFAEQVRQKSDKLQERLKKIVQSTDAPLGLKGRGLMVGIECECGEVASRVCQHAFKMGLVIETSGPDGEVVKLLPPLTVSEAEIVKAMDIVARSVDEVLS